MTQRVVNYTYGTGNSVLPDGSVDVRDGIDNLQSLDIFMNADEDTYNQRDGGIVKTRAGAVRDVGIRRIGDFTTGCTITERNQGVLYETDGTVYVWLGALPKVVPPLSSPATTGGISPAGNWVDVGDASLRNQIIKTNTTEIVRVPGNFPDIQSAVDYLLSGRISVIGYEADVLIEAGFSPSSGITLTSEDASYISIKSVDPIVNLSTTFPTSSDFIRVDKYGKGPKLECLIDANSRCATGYYITNGSSGFIGAGCGVKNSFGSGLLVKYGSTCIADDSVWTGAAQGGGIESGILSWGSSVSAERADVTGSLHYGAQSGHGGYLAFRKGKANNCMRYGIRATDMGVIDADGTEASNCGVNGLRAFNIGFINARDVIVTGCGSNADTNSGNVSASEGSTINVTGGNISGSKQYGINANNSTVTATLANVSGSFGIGVDARAASKISLSSATITDSGSNGINSVSSNIYAVNANLDRSGSYGIMALGASTIDAENSTARGCGTGGISSRERSSVNATNSDVTGSALPNGSGLYAIGGSIDALGAKARVGDGTTDTTKDIIVSKGGIISADGNTIGGLSQMANTIAANGIIFK